MQENINPQNFFSPELIAECQKLLLDQAGIEISEDQAEIYLEKLGRLMLAIVKIADEKDKKSNGKDRPNQ